MIARLLRLWRTVRPLRWQQIVGRLWFRLRKPAPRLGPAPNWRGQAQVWRQAAGRAPSLFGPRQLRLLNEDFQLAAAADWQAPGRSELFRYNLHYFDDLNAIGGRQRRAWQRSLLQRWIDDNPPARGVGWAPYPTSLRIVNWVKASLDGLELDAAARQSLAVQARQLERRLEWHLLGNHLLANAKALVFAGCAFDGVEAQRWRQRGLSILERQLPEQLLPDGGQFELSPMYHALALEDLLDLINLAGVWPGLLPEHCEQHWRGLAQRMWRWLALMCHPDGELSFFNDSVPGVAPAPAELAAYAGRLGIVAPAPAQACEHLSDSGYVRLQRADAVLLADVGRIGPDYLPGHAHADQLAFELSLGRHRVLVNRGIDRYGHGAERVRQRGTAAHNTVLVDGQDSAEVWSGFRVGRRGQPLPAEVGVDGEALWVSGAHTGYRHLPGRVLHRRRWRLASDGLQIEDRIEGRYRTALAHFHFAPHCRVFAADDAWCIEVDGQWRIWLAIEGASARLHADSHHPGFGLRQPAQSLKLEINAGRLLTRWRWQGLGLAG